MSNLNDLVWAEHYRPKTIADCILGEETKKMIVDCIAKNNIPHFLMIGSAGTGKTTLCRAIANEIGADLLYINASLERSIDVIRTKVISFSSSVSLSGGLKIVLLDEFDGMENLQQNSMKGVIEEFPNTRFFFTTNHAHKVIDPIKSRCVVLDFNVKSEEKSKLAMKFFKRISGILDEKKIKYDPKVVAGLVTNYFPDFRRTLNELQRHSVSGEIDSSILLSNNKAVLDSLYSSMKKKNFTEVRKWVGQNTDIEPHVLFREIYDGSVDLFEQACIPQLVLILADYSFKATHSVDREILIVAAMVEIMLAVTWK